MAQIILTGKSSINTIWIMINGISCLRLVDTISSKFPPDILYWGGLWLIGKFPSDKFSQRVLWQKWFFGQNINFLYFLANFSQKLGFCQFLPVSGKNPLGFCRGFYRFLPAGKNRLVKTGPTLRSNNTGKYKEKMM